MGFFSNIKHKQINLSLRELCCAILASFLAFEDQIKRGKIETKLFSDLAGMALSTRPGWKEINKKVFEHKSGVKLKIK